jgi:sarcosine oxidase subunit beta
MTEARTQRWCNSVETADAVVVGAGIIGLSVAYELARGGVERIAVLEKEELPGMGATSACTGGIRLQFSSEANIRFSKYSLDRYALFDRELGIEIGLKSNGYLFLLTDRSQIPLYVEGHRSQNAMGVVSVFVDREWIRRIAPFLSLDDVLSGSYCPQEAHADPHTVIEAYLRGLRGFGIEVQTRREVTGVEVAGGRIKALSTSRRSISTRVVVNCAGAYAGGIARLAGIDLALVSRKRHVLVVKPPLALEQNLPLIVDGGTGWYLKAEPGGIALMGGTDREGTVSLDNLAEPETIDRIVEAGIKRVPSFGEAGMIRTIVGLRCMSADDHALIGKLPNIGGFYCAAGFSGHGFMHAPATGIALAELILHGRSSSLDLSPFDPCRFANRTSDSRHERYVF